MLEVPSLSMSTPYLSKKSLQEAYKLDYKLRFCRCRGCVAELHRETTDYYTTSFADSWRGKSSMDGFGTTGMVYPKFLVI